MGYADAATSGSKQRRVRRGEIYWFEAQLPRSGGENTRLPVLVIQNDIGNTFSSEIIVSAISFRLSTSDNPVSVRLPDGILNRESEVRLNQVWTINSDRLGDRVGRLPDELIARVDEAISISLGLAKTGMFDACP